MNPDSVDCRSLWQRDRRESCQCRWGRRDGKRNRNAREPQSISVAPQTVSDDPTPSSVLILERPDSTEKRIGERGRQRSSPVGHAGGNNAQQSTSCREIQREEHHRLRDACRVRPRLTWGQKVCQAKCEVGIRIL